MKTNLNKTGMLARVATGALLMLGACKGLAPMEAKAQVTPTTIQVATNVPAVITTAMNSNVTCYIPVRQGRSLALQGRFALSGSGTDNNLFYFYPRVDGTNIATLAPFIITAAGNGTTAVNWWTNIAATALQGVTDLAFTSISNATARTMYFTNLVFSTAQ